MKPALQFLNMQLSHVQTLCKYDQGTHKWRRPKLRSLCRALHFGEPWDLPPLSVPPEQDLTVLTLQSAFSDAQAVGVACTWPGRTVCRVFLQTSDHA